MATLGRLGPAIVVAVVVVVVVVVVHEDFPFHSGAHLMLYPIKTWGFSIDGKAAEV
jgi:hypothetical protein